MNRSAVALVLEQIGTLLELQGENPFKARAFATAARAIEQADDFDAAVRGHRLEQIPGIGKATAAVIRELVQTGRSSYYEDLRARTPSGLLDLLAIPRLGATRIRTLRERLGIESLDALEEAARQGRIAGLPGFGPRTQARILDGIAHVRSGLGRKRQADAFELAERLRAFIASLPGIARAELGGEVRRACETVGSIDIVAVAAGPSATDALDRFLSVPGLERVEHRTANEVQVRLADGLPVRVILVEPAALPVAILDATGSAAHVARLAALARERGFTLTQTSLLARDGRALPLADEEDVYAALGLAWVPPELRETGEEVDAAVSGTLPALVRWEDLRGCFHCHTSWSDGRASVAQMAEAALERGWRYLGIADHSQYASYAGGLTPEQVVAQHAEIDAWNEQHGRRLWVFKGIEADILPDGRIDFEDQPALLARFDYVIASAHSAFALDREAQTRRFLRAIANPYVTFLGHLTGRLLLLRPGYELDLPAVLRAAAERGVGIEINADPHRMELDWRHWREAKRLGIRTAINPDAHSPAQLDFVDYGLTVARKGWLEPADIVNCGSLTAVRRFFRNTRGRPRA